MAGYVLIVDSNVDLQNQIAAALREAGYELAAETDGAWAKRSIAVRAPDAVVLGTRLGDGDGFRLAEQLRQDPDTSTVPIVFIASTHRGASHRAEARRRFAPADYLLTPLDPSTVVPRVAELVARGYARTPPPTVEDEPEFSPPSETVPAKPSLRDPIQTRESRLVERNAKTLVADPAKPEVAGTLKRTPFPRVLQRLYAERATGSLLLLRETTKKIVAFAGGYPVWVRSNVPGETLGQILLEKHLITPEILAESVKRMLREKRHHGQILIEMGALSPFNLERALAHQLEAKLLEIFSWSDGKFMFKAGETPPAGAMRLERSPAALILEGIRRHYDADRQDEAIDRYGGHRIALASDPVLRLQDMTADASDLAFIRSIDGKRPVRSLLERAEIAPDKARLLLVALSESGNDPGDRGHVAQQAPAASVGGAGRGGEKERRRPGGFGPDYSATFGRPARDDAADSPYARLLLGPWRGARRNRRRHRPRLRIAGPRLSPRSLPPRARGRPPGGRGDFRTPHRGAPDPPRSGAPAELPFQARSRPG